MEKRINEYEVLEFKGKEIEYPFLNRAERRKKFVKNNKGFVYRNNFKITRKSR